MSIKDEKWFKDRAFRPDVISEDYAEPSDNPEYWGKTEIAHEFSIEEIEKANEELRKVQNIKVKKSIL